jgi:hypothetical protein
VFSLCCAIITVMSPVKYNDILCVWIERERYQMTACSSPLLNRADQCVAKELQWLIVVGGDSSNKDSFQKTVPWE